MRLRVYSVFSLPLVLGCNVSADALYRVTDLSTAIGRPASAVAINNAGQVVGSTSNGGYLYSNGQVTDLGPFSPRGINNVGQIVGVVSTTDSVRALLYSNGQFADLGTLGGSVTYANG